MTDDDWMDYSSEFMFPAEGMECTPMCLAAAHDPQDHGYDSCEREGCDCENHWEHT
jgi:hypothetical protein